MKNFCFLHILLLLLFLLVYQFSNSQDYVVTAKGDTIYGAVKSLSYGPEKKVQVTASNKKKSVYTIFQTQAFSLNGDTYRPVKRENGYTFMKVIKPGYLTLYAFQPENQVAYDGLFLMRKDGIGLEVPNLTFKKQMRNYLQDCPEVSAKIENGELNKKSLDKIVDEYNACIHQRTTDHLKQAIKTEQTTKKISAWDVLEAKVKDKPDFEGKSDGLDMISDIKNKIKNGEKVPNFLLEGLKSSLAKAELNEEIDNALKELKN